MAGSSGNSAVNAGGNVRVSVRSSYRLRSRPISARHLALTTGTVCCFVVFLKMSTWHSGSEPLLKVWERYSSNGRETVSTPIVKERILIVTSPPSYCLTIARGSGHIPEILKNHADFARKNNYDVYFSFDDINSELPNDWNKIYLLEKLMNLYPYSYDWIWWIDHETLITDLNLNFPFDKISPETNLILAARENVDFFKEPSYGTINTGTFLIKNDPWSLQLLQNMDIERKKAIQFKSGLNTSLWEVVKGMPGVTDQAVLLYLLFKMGLKNQKDIGKISFQGSILGGLRFSFSDAMKKLVELSRFQMSANSENDKPFLINFASCGFCTDQSEVEEEKCRTDFRFAYNFADNQVLAEMQLQHTDISSVSSLRGLPQSGKDR